jgi:cell division septum initiation protein DivIVA
MSTDDPIKLLQERSLPVIRKGYDRAATDELLDKLEASLSSILAEYGRVRGRLAELETKVAQGRGHEKEIMQALLLASRVQAESEERADEIVRAARAEAERLVADANDKVRTLEQLTSDAEGLATEAQARVTTFLESLLGAIEERGADFDSAVDELRARAGEDLKARGSAGAAGAVSEDGEPAGIG